MSHVEAEKFIKDIFSAIKKSKTIQELEIIPDTLGVDLKNRFNSSLYPKIEFIINKEDILALVDNEILNEEYNFTRNLSSKLEDPLTKLLYAALWKNGDLKKIQHIIKGIVEVDQENTNQENAMVFYQFGKHLANAKEEPIIDQHVIRAFSVYKNPGLKQCADLRNMGAISKKHKDIINEYKTWLTSEELSLDLKKNPDYSYHIDKLLFAAGKTIKMKK